MKLKITLMVLAMALVTCVYVLVKQRDRKENLLGEVPVDNADKAGDEAVTLECPGGNISGLWATNKHSR